MSLLNIKHRNYFTEVNKFVNSSEFKNLRYIISKALKNKNINTNRVLYISDSKNEITNNCENYLLYVSNSLKLYYVNNNFFKIKEWPLREIDKICFNIIVNLSICDVVIEKTDICFDDSKKIDFYLNDI